MKQGLMVFVFLGFFGAQQGIRAASIVASSSGDGVMSNEGDDGVQEKQKKGFFNWLHLQNPFKRKGTEEGRLTDADKRKLYEALEKNQQESKKNKALHYTKLTAKGLYNITSWALGVLQKTVVFSSDVLRLILLFMCLTKGAVVPIVSLAL